MQYLVAVVSEDVLRPEHVVDRLQGKVPATLVPESRASTALTSPSDPPPRFRSLSEELRALEATRMRQALEATHGNATQAAALLAMPSRTFFEKAKLYELGRDGSPRPPTNRPRVVVNKPGWNDETTATDIDAKRRRRRS
jgi:DNA-binding NtrC family response regulator